MRIKNERFKPLVDKLSYFIWVPTIILLFGATALSWLAPAGFIIMLGVDIFTVYFLISPIFGYVELKENSVFVKFGFIMKIDIPYEKIRGVSMERKIYADSMLALKNALSHVNIRYNKFDVVSISVVTNDRFTEELEARLSIAHRQ